MSSYLGKVGKKDFFLDSFSIESNRPLIFTDLNKVALLTTVAGYLKEDEINIEGFVNYDISSLNDFMSFLLNDKRAAPRKFNLNFSFSKKSSQNIQLPSKSQVEKHDEECLISFSAGVDSTAALMTALDKNLKVKLMWIDFGQKNALVEKKKVIKICQKFKVKPIVLKIDLAKFVEEGWNEWKHGIIPARNFLFISFAAFYLLSSKTKIKRIWLSAHKGEISATNTDKSIRFFKTSSKMFSQVFNQKFIVETPFFKYSKVEILSHWKKHWLEKYKLHPSETTSCYLGNSCGICKACVNRSMNFLIAGLKPEKFIVNPMADKARIIRDGYIKRFDTLLPERKVDFLISFKKAYAVLPKSIKEFYQKESKKYRGAMVQREKEIEKVVIK